MENFINHNHQQQADTGKKRQKIIIFYSRLIYNIIASCLAAAFPPFSVAFANFSLPHDDLSLNENHEKWIFLFTDSVAERGRTSLFGWWDEIIRTWDFMLKIYYGF